MTPEEILERAIQKAIDGGCTWLKGAKTEVWAQGKLQVITTPDGAIHDVEAVVFNHDFAKALWGEGQMGSLRKHGIRVGVSGWQYHLQQMVIADDPIAYLGKNI